MVLDFARNTLSPPRRALRNADRAPTLPTRGREKDFQRSTHPRNRGRIEVEPAYDEKVSFPFAASRIASLCTLPRMGKGSGRG